MKKIILVAAIVSTLSGCALESQQVTDARAWIVKNGPPSYNTKEECDQMWKKAQLAILQVSPTKIQTANDVQIDTFNSPNNFDIHYGATREDFNGGKCIIDIEGTIYGQVSPVHTKLVMEKMGWGK
jgi:hypothetical protein